MKRARSVAAVVVVLAVAAAGCTPREPVLPSPEFRPGGEAGGDAYFPAQGNDGYDVFAYDLKLRYDPATGRLGGAATVIGRAHQDLSRFSLDLAGFDVTDVTVGGRPAAAVSRGPGKLIITPDRGIERNARFTTTITYAGTPPAPWQRTADGAFALATPPTAGTWYPVNSRLDDKATFALAMTVPDGLAALSNGVPGPRTTDGGWTTWTWSENDPMTTYATFVAIGRYRVTETTHDGRQTVTAVPDSLPPDGPAATALERTGEVADFLATQFGDYPFDAYGGVILDDPRAAYAQGTQTRPVYSRAAFRTGPNTAVLARELAGQWFGAYVTPNRWRDAWLSAAFATYAEWLWQEKAGHQTMEQSFDRSYAGFDWRLRADDPGPAAVLSPPVAQRGGMTLYALRAEIGPQMFSRVLRAWPHEHRGGNADTADFVTLAERVSGRDLDTFFQTWLSGSGRPPHPGGSVSPAGR